MLEYDVADTAGRTPPPLAGADPAAYLGADEVVQSDNAEIARLAAELREGTPPDDIAFTRPGRERVAFVADPAAGEVDYPDIMARPAGPVLAALRGSDDVLELCRNGLPPALDSGGTEVSS